MSVFLLSLKGQIEKATFPDYPELFIKYQFVYGDDWIVTTGMEEGITQVCRRYDMAQDFTFNFPLDITFKSTNPRGWPQIVLCAYGRDSWGQEVIRGYGVSFVPVSLGSELRKTVGMFVPDTSNVASKFSTLLSGRLPELYDPRILTRNRGREVLRTNSKGCIHLVFNVVSKDTQHLAYSLASQERGLTIHLPERSSQLVQERRRSSQQEKGTEPSLTSETDQFNSLPTHPHDRGDMPLRSSEAPMSPPGRPGRRETSPRQSLSSPPAALSPRITVVRRMQEEKEELEAAPSTSLTPLSPLVRRSSENVQQNRVESDD